jgi:hypothetical protein
MLFFPIHEFYEKPPKLDVPSVFDSPGQIMRQPSFSLALEL